MGRITEWKLARRRPSGKTKEPRKARARVGVVLVTVPTATRTQNDGCRLRWKPAAQRKRQGSTPVPSHNRPPELWPCSATAPALAPLHRPRVFACGASTSLYRQPSCSASGRVCWMRMLVRSSENLPDALRRWRSLNRYRSNAPPGNIQSRSTRRSLNHRPEQGQSAARCALQAHPVVAAVPSWWRSLHMGVSANRRNQSGDT
ncbi:MAG: hypothetical protein FAZ92_03731 [Accumulibacter sp.]|nr:MAG: hypothetical protein FAZ92_03731 [Accumulibacter sp.]